jgi:rubrerythrin
MTILPRSKNEVARYFMMKKGEIAPYMCPKCGLLTDGPPNIGWFTCPRCRYTGTENEFSDVVYTLDQFLQ